MPAGSDLAPYKWPGIAAQEPVPRRSVFSLSTLRHLGARAEPRPFLFHRVHLLSFPVRSCN